MRHPRPNPRPSLAQALVIFLQGLAGDVMCRERLGNTAGNALEDYFALFRRQAFLDFIFASVVLGSFVLPSTEHLLRIVGAVQVCVVLISLCDVALVLHFNSGCARPPPGTRLTKTTFSWASSEGSEFSLRSLRLHVPIW